MTMIHFADFVSKTIAKNTFWEKFKVLSYTYLVSVGQVDMAYQQTANLLEKKT